MPDRTKYIPLEAISDHYPVTIHAYPPDREQLQIDVNNFAAAWNTANPSGSRVDLAFIRDVPKDEPTHELTSQPS